MLSGIELTLKHIIMKVGDKVRVVHGSSNGGRSYKAGDIRTITWEDGVFATLDNKHWKILTIKLEVIYDFNNYLKELD